MCLQVMCACINTLAHSSSHSPSKNPEVPLPPAPLLILFSGGVDSTLLAALAHRALPSHLPIDLSCVCFDGGSSPDMTAARDALLELRAFAPERKWRLIEVLASLADVDAHRYRKALLIKGLIYPKPCSNPSQALRISCSNSSMAFERLPCEFCFLRLRRDD